MSSVAASDDQDRRHLADAASAGTRGRLRLAWDVVFGFLRLIRKHVANAYLVFGIFLLSGAAIAVAGTWGFAKIAGHVRSGATQAFDDAVMLWIGDHQN